ncbi:MAG: hypothetical protein VX663_10830, partial [Pseudomonadota bacterium]|nr:hypothetical protein [Pseudomonadota bacterium]
LTTRLTRRVLRACLLRDHLWQGRDFSQLFAVVTRQPTTPPADAQPAAGTRHAHWDEATAGIVPTGGRITVTDDAQPQKLVETLRDIRAAYLRIPSESLDRLLRYLDQTSAPGPRFHQVISVGMSAAGTKAACARLLGAQLVEICQTPALGIVALPCPDSADRHHVQSENVMVETLHPDGSPCAPGEAGRVVVTDLNNYATPIIRYALGSTAAQEVGCACGRSAPVLTNIRQEFLATLSA